MSFNLRANKQCVVLREKTPVDEFYTEEVVTRNGSSAIRVVDPIYVVFNQERIKHLGDTAIAAWLESMIRQKDSSVAKLKSQVSDQDLIRTIKSRYLQTPSELRAWAEYCAANLDDFNDQVRAAIEEDLPKDPQPTVVDPQPTSVQTKNE